MSEEKKKQDGLQLDLSLLLRGAGKVLQRFWWLFAILVVVFSLLTMLIWNAVYIPSYKSYCSFTVKVVNNSTTGEINTLYGFYYDKDLAEQLDKTFTYILTSDLLNDEIREQLGHNVEAGNIESTCITGSNLFVLSTYGDTPQASEELLQAVLSVYEDAARYIVGELQVELVEQPVIGQTPNNSPSILVCAVIGVLCSAVVGLICSLLQLNYMRTVRKPEDLEDQVNMPCLGIVPVTDHKQAERSGAVSHTRAQGEFRESIRGIARKLEQAMDESGKKILLVTGTIPGEGKTTLCRHLAQTLAEWGKQVCLLDGDLRKPSVYRHFNIRGRSMPFQQALLGQVSVDCVTDKPRQNLCLIANTEPVTEPTVLLDSPEMEQFIASLAENSDYLIIDAPPCDTMSDVTVLQRYADAVLYVVRQDYAQLRKIIEAVEGLFEAEDKLLGYVLNGAKKSAQGYGKYGYGAYSYGKYGYGYYSKSRYSKYYEEDSGGPSEK